MLLKKNYSIYISYPNIEAKDKGKSIDIEVHSSKDSVFVSVDGTKVIKVSECKKKF